MGSRTESVAVKSRRRAPEHDLRFPPPEKPEQEPEEAPRWLHGLAGLVIGGVLGLAFAGELWRTLDIPRPLSIVGMSVGLSAAAASWRSRWWRWMNL
jgi:hypothetical protein